MVESISQIPENETPKAIHLKTKNQISIHLTVRGIQKRILKINSTVTTVTAVLNQNEIQLSTLSHGCKSILMVGGNDSKHIKLGENGENLFLIHVLARFFVNLPKIFLKRRLGCRNLGA